MNSSGLKCCLVTGYLTNVAMAFGTVHFFTTSQVFILCFSLFSAHVQGHNESCEVTVQLKRNSTAEAFSEKSLMINCTVKHCGERPPVRWCEVTYLNDCSPINETDQMEVVWRENKELSSILSLHFKHITINDSGLYRCKCESKSESCISHSISVTVKEEMLDVEQTVNNKNKTANVSLDETAGIPDWYWPAIYISSGITSVVIVAILSCLGFRCRSGQASAEKPADNQYASVQMSNMGPPLPDSSHPSQSKQRNRSHPTPASAERQGERLYEHCNDMGSRPTSNIPSRDVIPSHRQLANHVVTQNRTEEEEAGTLVYASLNHQSTNRLQTRAIEVTEESTEYAAVRRC